MLDDYIRIALYNQHYFRFLFSLGARDIFPEPHFLFRMRSGITLGNWRLLHMAHTNLRDFGWAT